MLIRLYRTSDADSGRDDNEFYPDTDYNLKTLFVRKPTKNSFLDT